MDLLKYRKQQTVESNPHRRIVHNKIAGGGYAFQQKITSSSSRFQHAEVVASFGGLYRSRVYTYKASLPR